MSWKKFLDSFKRHNPMLMSMLTMGQVRAVEDNKIMIAYGPSYAANMQVVRKPEKKAVIEEALREFYKLTVRVEFELDETQAAVAPARKHTETIQVDADDLLEKDPDLRKMVEQIDGEIIGRRKIEE